MWQSSNPALHNDKAFEEFYGSRGMTAAQPATATLQGVVNKTGMLLLLAITGGAGGYALSASMPSLLWISAIVSALVCFGVYFVIAGRPALARYLAPVYAIVEGAFLGALTGVLDRSLAQMGYAVAGGVALQAFIITLSICLAMLGLYSVRILRPTRLFVAIVSVATAGIMITYAASWVLGIFFGVGLPFVSLGSALAGGTPALIGLGINVLILGVASAWLIIDFSLVERQVAQGGPKSMEWYLGFALLVTLAWVYFEAVKLVFRLAVLFGNRD